MPTEKRILGQTQHTESIPLGSQKLQPTGAAIPVAGGFAPTSTGFSSSSSGFLASEKSLPLNTGFVDTTTSSLSTTSSASLPTSVATTRVVEQPILENVVERTFIEKRNLQNITEIHEQPVYEIHEKPIIENVTAAAEVKRIGGQVLHEEVRHDQGFMLPAKPSTVHRTHEQFVSEVTEAPKINVQHQKHINIIEQPVITEIINKPVVEISETNIQRVIHERPIVTVVREQPITETVATASFPITSTATAAPLVGALPQQTLNVTTTDTLVQETHRGSTSGNLSKTEKRKLL